MKKQITTNTKITEEKTGKIAQLANIPIDKKQEESLTKQFNETLNVVEDLNKLDTEDVPGTFNVTGLEDIFRDDVVDNSRILTQEQALANAKDTSNGFFVVEAILDEK